MIRERESRPSAAEAASEEFGGSAHDDTKTTAKKAVRSASPKVAQRTENEIIADVTADYIVDLDPAALPPAVQIERELIAATNFAFGAENVNRVQGNKITLLKTLHFTQVAQLMISLHHVVKVAPSGKNSDPDFDLLAIYCPSGRDAGIYLTAEDDIRRVARGYNRQLTTVQFREVFTVLREAAPRVHRCADRDLIAVSNGVFNYQTKELGPFSPDLVFLSKCAVAYDPAATSPVIDTPDGDTWEVEEWMCSLNDDDDVVELLWQITGAVIRPHVRWNKSAWFFSEKGNNGKGTLISMMRNLCGPGAHTSIPLSEMGKDFMLEPLTRASAVLVDENDVGTFIDKAANLKAIITNDVIMINRKYKQPVSYQFWGFMVQCLNEFPRIKDKSDSFYRRQLFVPFTKCFTGAERTYIKDDYLRRDDVLRYVLKRVLHMDYYKLSEPDAVRSLLAEYKEFNDPLRAFWSEMREVFVWDMLPLNFLYALYKSWFAKVNPSGSPLGRNMFARELDRLVADDDLWDLSPAQTNRPAGRMDAPEHLIAAYELRDWYNGAYQVPKGASVNLDKLCTPFPIAATYRHCYLRRGTGPQASQHLVVPGPVDGSRGVGEESPVTQ